MPGLKPFRSSYYSSPPLPPPLLLPLPPPPLLLPLLLHFLLLPPLLHCYLRHHHHHHLRHRRHRHLVRHLTILQNAFRHPEKTYTNKHTGRAVRSLSAYALGGKIQTKAETGRRQEVMHIGKLRHPHPHSQACVHQTHSTQKLRETHTSSCTTTRTSTRGRRGRRTLIVTTALRRA